MQRAVDARIDHPRNGYGSFERRAPFTLTDRIVCAKPKAQFDTFTNGFVAGLDGPPCALE